MAHVIAQGCCNDASCVGVCPVQCIRPRPGDVDFMTTEQLYIDPSSCIDCGACARACPTGAIYPSSQLPPALQVFRAVNSDYFADYPLKPVAPPSVTRRWVPEDGGVVRVAVVGAGPSGMYVAEALSEIVNVSVTLIERLPVPYGLLRSGVAPDHHRTKLVGDRFDRVLARPNVMCYFNTAVGEHVSVDELVRHHHAVIWAVGTPDGRRLNIPGEGLAGVTTARDVTAWYNGHPDYATAAPNLEGRRVVVVGNGNVAIDVARLLALPPSELEASTVSPTALRVLNASAVREVVVVGRSGHTEAAYGTSELLEMARLPDVDLLALSREVAEEARGSSTGRRVLSPLLADRRRSVVESAAQRVPSLTRRIVMRYGLSPVRFLGDQVLTGVEFMGADGRTEVIPTSLVVTAVGFSGAPIHGVPFEAGYNTISNEAGRVTEGRPGDVVPGAYCVGWVKRGPSGTLGTNRWDAAAVVDALLEDLRGGRLVVPPAAGDEFARLISSRHNGVVTSEGWVRIDAAERDAGRELGRPRVPLLTTDEMVRAARNSERRDVSSREGW